METLALVLWIMTGLGGLYMAGVAARSGRRDSAARTSNLPSWAIFGHGALAVIGLGAWAAYMRTENDALGWSLLGLLGVVVLGGAAMFLRWSRDRRGADRWQLAEQQIPSSVVHGHGALAALTVLAVLLTLLGLGKG